MTKFNPEKEHDLDHLEGQIAALWARVNYTFNWMLAEKKRKARRKKKPRIAQKPILKGVRATKRGRG